VDRKDNKFYFHHLGASLLKTFFSKLKFEISLFFQKKITPDFQMFNNNGKSTIFNLESWEKFIEVITNLYFHLVMKFWLSALQKVPLSMISKLGL